MCDMPITIRYKNKKLCFKENQVYNFTRNIKYFKINKNKYFY